MWKTKSDAARRMIQAKFAQKRMARIGFSSGAGLLWPGPGLLGGS